MNMLAVMVAIRAPYWSCGLRGSDDSGGGNSSPQPVCWPGHPELHPFSSESWSRIPPVGMGGRGLPAGHAGRWRRDWMTPNRPGAKSASVYFAFAAGFPPVAWKSENAADWLTYTAPVRFSDRATPASSAASRTAARYCSLVEYTLAVSAPFAPATLRNNATEAAALGVDTR